MINAMGEVLNQKTLAEYKVIEDRYLTLKRYLRILIKNNRLDVQSIESIESILYALDPPLPISYEEESEEE